MKVKKSKTTRVVLRYLFGAFILFVGLYSYFVLAGSPAFGERPGVCIFSLAAFVAGVVMLADFTADGDEDSEGSGDSNGKEENK